MYNLSSLVDFLCVYFQVDFGLAEKRSKDVCNVNFGEAARRSQALNSCLFSDAAKRAAGGPGVGRGRLVYVCRVRSETKTFKTCEHDPFCQMSVKGVGLASPQTFNRVTS